MSDTLRDEQPVERICMDRRETLDRERRFLIDGERYDSAPLTLLLHEGTRDDTEIEYADHRLYHDLVGRRGTQKNIVLRVFVEPNREFAQL